MAGPATQAGFFNSATGTNHGNLYTNLCAAITPEPHLDYGVGDPT